MGIFVIMLASSTTAPSSDRSADAFSAHQKLNQMFFFQAPHHTPAFNQSFVL